eukprot:TRINITY_DN1654_c0_g1_i2.p1 TRINITY_DN1654_c0_g1~~TRINITY_DN1654_c0_g1_i2.p1  ORF type:complete len:292 (+),score=62.39 TRINITY_DN1654_c0_g1_i2:272-1147(+)
MALGEYMKVKCCMCIGGTSVRETIDSLKNSCQVVVGTPGRVIDMLNRKVLVAKNIKLLILDESTTLLSRGFKDSIYNIFQKLPVKVQVAIFSTMMPQEVMDLTARFMESPIIIKEKQNLKDIKQFYVSVQREELKLHTLCELFNTLWGTISQSVVFCNTRRKVEWLSEQIHQNHKNFTSISSIHGDLDMKDRNTIMGNFRAGLTRVLITTDVVGHSTQGRDVSLVVNYDMPTYPETYVCRICCCSAAGTSRKGVAINMVTEESISTTIKEIEHLYETSMDPLPTCVLAVFS